MTERNALYSAVLADPEDVTLRLVFADWLDEQPTTTCKLCLGKWRTVRTTDEPDGHTTVEIGGKWQRCPDCRGAGFDTSDADLAEFIRAQCEIPLLLDAAERLEADPTSGCGGVPYRTRLETLQLRDAELRRLHPEWRRAECPECEGSGKVKSVVPPDPQPVYRTVYEAQIATPPILIREYSCQTCGGTGDLLKRERILIDEYGAARGRDIVDRPVTFRNGSIDSVECELGELGTEQSAPSLHGIGFRNVFVASRWAKAVVRAFPVTRFVDPSLKPTREEGGWEWYGLPDWLSLPETKLTFPTAEAAADAPALACGRTIRKSVWKV